MANNSGETVLLVQEFLGSAKWPMMDDQYKGG